MSNYEYYNFLARFMIYNKENKLNEKQKIIITNKFKK
jgi:hypothetical protein